jgi:hypothetical protein
MFPVCSSAKRAKKIRSTFSMDFHRADVLRSETPVPLRNVATQLNASAADFLQNFYTLTL